MTRQKAPQGAGDERDLQELLVQSLESLRGSRSERRKFPALDRMLSRIEARERQMAARDATWSFRQRWLFAPLTAAAAGFAGAALALIVLPVAETPPLVESPPVLLRQSSAAGEDLDRSIQRLENAVRGLEKFQPLLESRIEWIEDVVQRHHSDAYVSVEHKKDPRRGPQQPGARLRGGNGV